MNLSGWNIDLREVYGFFGWRRRSRFHLTEQLYESSDSACAALFFGIGEVGINKQVGSLALFKDKASPRMVWNSGGKLFWFEGAPGEPVLFTADGRMARLYEYLCGWDERPAWRERILELKKERLLASQGPRGFWERLSDLIRRR